MGVSFGLSAVEQLGGGEVRPLPGAEMRCSDILRQLPALLDPSDGSRGRRGAAKAFPWYFRSYEWDSGRPPSVSDCADPKRVLASVHALERELSRKPKTYPAEWNLWVQQSDGREVLQPQLTGLYRGKLCRLFTDQQGAWAVEANSPMAFPVHHPLSDRVSVQVEGKEQPVSVRIESISPLQAHEELLSAMKRVCLAAMDRGALILPAIA
jgi:hypothetical protein